MTMTKRARSNGLQKSEQLLGAGTNAQGYGIGVIGPDPRRTDFLLVLVFVVAIALSFVFLGVIIIPGVLLVAAMHGAIDRPASVAVTNRGIAIFARSELSGRPRKVLTVLPHGVLTDGTVEHSGSYVHLPNLHLWFRKREYERLLAAVAPESVGTHLGAPVLAGVAAATSGPVFATPSGAVAIAPSPSPSTAPTPTPTPTPDAPKESRASQPEHESDVVYCSWCGKQRAVNAPSIHYCGSMERPVVYCMKCGTAFEEGATACTSCGTPITKISR
jgi:hypothetical protein